MKNKTEIEFTVPKNKFYVFIDKGFLVESKPLKKTIKIKIKKGVK